MKAWGLEERESELQALRGAEVGKDFQERGQHAQAHGIGGWACSGPCRGREMEQTPRRTVRRTSAGSWGKAQSQAPVLSSEAPDTGRTAKDQRCPIPTPAPQTRSEQRMWGGEEGQCGSKSLCRKTDPNTTPHNRLCDQAHHNVPDPLCPQTESGKSA